MKKVLFVFLAAVVAVGLFMMPGMVQSSIPAVYYITPNRKTYENIINCTGSIQSGNVREIYVQSAIVPAEVCVGIGDYVNEGDILAIVDIEKSEKLSGSALGILSALSGDALGKGIGAGGIDWTSLAASYGLSAVINGAGIDYGSIQGILNGAGDTQQMPTAGTIIGEDIPNEITAPMAGVITEVNLRPETPASSGKAVFAITDTSCYKAVASVGEGDIAKIEIGDNAKVRGVGFSGSTYNGVITKISPIARKSLTSSETVVDVEITLDKPDKRLKPGFSAKVEITGGNLYDLITIPYEAVRQDENNDEYVYVYEDGKLKKQVIVTGQELTNEVEVLDGVSADSIVVFNPGGLVREGAMINIKGRANTD